MDRRQLEFLKSGKLVPVHFSSRFWDFKRSKWVFGKASDEEIAALLSRKVYWQTKAGGAAWLGDPAEALYVETTVAHCVEIGRRLEREGLIKLEGESAVATPALIAQGAKFEADRRAALEELEKKHAFERG